MAKNKNNVETRTSIDDLNETLTSVEQHVENNKKTILWVVLAIIAIAAITLGFYYLIYQPGKQQAADAISKADIEMVVGNDSIALAQYMEIANNESGAPAHRAALESAIALYKQGKYEEALNYANKADFSDDVVNAAAKSLAADCYVNLQQYDKAVAQYDKAISASNSNSLYTPVFMLKKANVLTEQGNYKAALETYETIKAKYPKFEMFYNVSIDQYIARAKARVE